MNSWDGEVGAVRRFLRRRFVHPFPTGSPFGHHPRLRMVCPLQGQWRHLRDSSIYLSTHNLSLLSQLHPRRVVHASGGGAPCLTAGDARARARVNPWGYGLRDLRRRRRRTASVESESQSCKERNSHLFSTRKKSFCCHVVTDEIMR